MFLHSDTENLGVNNKKYDLKNFHLDGTLIYALHWTWKILKVKTKFQITFWKLLAQRVDTGQNSVITAHVRIQRWLTYLTTFV